MKAEKAPKIKTQDKVYRTWFDFVNAFLLIILALVAVYPFWYVLMVSLNDPTDSLNGPLYFLPRVFTLENFRTLFAGYDVMSAVFFSVARTVLGSVSSVLVTGMFAYALSKTYLRGQKWYILLMMIPMYIGGGLIPTFLVLKAIGLYQNFLVYILPALFSSYNALIMFTNFKSFPHELEESVTIDGGSDMTIFFRIVIPVSKPLFATILLFNAVGQWNSWFDTLLYGGKKLMTLQALLVTIIREAQQALEMVQKIGTAGAAGYTPTVASITATATIVAALPIVIVYPFFQKHFVSNMMLGSLKQ